jgi:hypothetical protein
MTDGIPLAEEREPPINPPMVAVGFAGDEAEDIGERIMAMTLRNAVSLSRYIEERLVEIYDE